MARDGTVFVDDPEVGENRRRAMRAIHIPVKPSRRAIRLGSASDPILALASRPYLAPPAIRTGW